MTIRPPETETPTVALSTVGGASGLTGCTHRLQPSIRPVRGSNHLGPGILLGREHREHDPLAARRAEDAQDLFPIDGARADDRPRIPEARPQLPGLERG